VAEDDRGRASQPRFDSHPTPSRVQTIESLLPTVMPLYVAQSRGETGRVDPEQAQS
jgi:hypothetical protein